jgi:hypothetical protein
MKTRKAAVTFSMLVVLAGFLSVDVAKVSAGDALGREEVIELLAGNTVNGYFMKQKESVLTGRVAIRIKFFVDGGAEQTTYPAKGSKGAFSEKGKWLVNEQGSLCLQWLPDPKMKCGRLERSGSGQYQLIRKGQKFVYEEILPGT